MNIMLIIGVIAFVIFLIFGYLWYGLFKHVGIVIHLLLTGLLIYVIVKIGIRNILIAIISIAAIVVLRKILINMIDNYRVHRIFKKNKYMYHKARGDTYIGSGPTGPRKQYEEIMTSNDMANNCPNCGAAIDKSICPYGGTRVIPYSL